MLRLKPLFPLLLLLIAGCVHTPVTAPTATDKKVELKDGSWASVKADGSVMVTTNHSTTWMIAPDGTWTAMDGSQISTRNGRIIKNQPQQQQSAEDERMGRVAAALAEYGRQDKERAQSQTPIQTNCSQFGYGFNCQTYR